MPISSRPPGFCVLPGRRRFYLHLLRRKRFCLVGQRTRIEDSIWAPLQVYTSKTGTLPCKYSFSQEPPPQVVWSPPLAWAQGFAEKLIIKKKLFSDMQNFKQRRNWNKVLKRDFHPGLKNTLGNKAACSLEGLVISVNTKFWCAHFPKLTNNHITRSRTERRKMALYFGPSQKNTWTNRGSISFYYTECTILAIIFFASAAAIDHSKRQTATELNDASKAQN